jgi:hypothetical protein
VDDLDWVSLEFCGLSAVILMSSIPTGWDGHGNHGRSTNTYMSHTGCENINCSANSSQWMKGKWTQEVQHPNHTLSKVPYRTRLEHEARYRRSFPSRAPSAHSRLAVEQSQWVIRRWKQKEWRKGPSSTSTFVRQLPSRKWRRSSSSHFIVTGPVHPYTMQITQQSRKSKRFIHFREKHRNTETTENPWHSTTWRPRAEEHIPSSVPNARV